MAVNEIVIAAGLNYTEYRDSKKQSVLYPASPGPWREFALRWAKKKFLEDKTVKITLFDYFLGTRENITFSKGKPVSTIEMAAKPLNFDNYRRVDAATRKLVIPERSLPLNTPDSNITYFTGVSEISNSAVSIDDYKNAFIAPGSTPPAEDSISVADLYDYLVATGTDRPNTVKEFHIFAHAWAGGPILVNSRDLGRNLRQRDTLDKDPREKKDFNGMNVTLDPFAKAFASDATSFIWGCIAFTFMKLLVKYTISQKSRIAKPDDKKYQFEWTPDWAVDLKQFHDFLGGSSPGKKSDKMSLNDIKAFITVRINDTYMQNLANASKNRVLGALPGTYTDLDNTGSTDQRFLHVPMGPLSNNAATENFLGSLYFFKKEMKIDFEPTKYGGWKPYGRGFGIYK